METRVESDITPIEHIPNSSKNEEDLVNKILNELENKNESLRNSDMTLESQPVLNIPVSTTQTSQNSQNSQACHIMKNIKSEFGDDISEDSENDEYEMEKPKRRGGSKNKKKRGGGYEVEENVKKDGFVSRVLNMFDIGDMYIYFKFTCVAIVLYFLMSVFSSRLEPFVHKIPYTFNVNNDVTYFGNAVLSLIFGIVFAIFNILLFR